MAHSNKKQTSTSNFPQGASKSRNGKAYSAGNDEGEINGKKAHRSFFSKRAPIILFFVVSCIFLKHPDNFDRHAEHAAKVHVYTRGARSLAKIKAIASEDELELYPMAFEHYDDATPTYEGAYEDAYDDIDEPYEADYAFSPKRIFSYAQWEEEEDGTILKERKVVEYEIPQQVHYERKCKITHDEREEEVDSNDTLSADVAVTEAVATCSTSLSKVGSGSSLPPSLQNKGQSAKTKQEPQGSSGTGTTASTKHGKKNKAVNVKTGRDFSRRKLAAYILY
ncbi:hypothetical protein AK88_05598, partial [Plasmodium fragile]